MDYKTDQVEGPEELVARYAGQLALYEEIAQKALGHPVKEKFSIPFISMGKFGYSLAFMRKTVDRMAMFC